MNCRCLNHSEASSSIDPGPLGFGSAQMHRVNLAVTLLSLLLVVDDDTWKRMVSPGRPERRLVYAAKPTSAIMVLVRVRLVGY